MSKAFDQQLIIYVSRRNNLSLQLETEISNRRSAKMFKLLSGEQQFGLKVATDVQASTAREAAVLRELSSFTPAYVDSGYYAGCAWLLLNWVAGQSAYRYVKQSRDSSEPDTKRLELFAAMFEKVAALHALGYLHGDLQPDHFRIAKNDVHLLDLALAHRTAERFDYPGALVHFSAPEICEQQLRETPVRYDEQAEQYALASAVFFLYTGHLSADYGSEGMKLGLEGKRKRIASGYRNTFSSIGCKPFTGLESVLEKCLAADKRARYLGVGEAARALRDLLPNSR